MPSSPEVLPVGAAGRTWRGVLLLGLGVLFVSGSVVGDDPWWPFGPWRMYSTSQAPTGSVWATGIEVRTGDDPTWRPAPLSPANVGLNRAEVEGRIPQILGDPALLGTLAASHDRLRPDAEPWVGVRVVRHHIGILDGQLTGDERVEVLAEWTAAP
jgi:hypothetical protein